MATDQGIALLNLTGGIARVVLGGAGSVMQPVGQALEVLPYKDVVLFLTCGFLGAANVTVRIWSGMRKDTDEGWVYVSAFALVIAQNFEERVAFSGTTSFGRYIRYEVVFTGASELNFEITGIGRP